MKESALYPIVKNHLVLLGAVPDKVPGSAFKMGLPDFIATYKGRAMHIEVKIVNPNKSGWAPTSLQLQHLRRHAAAGAFCCVLEYHAGTQTWRLLPINAFEGGRPGGMSIIATNSKGHLGLSEILRAFVRGVV